MEINEYQQFTRSTAIYPYEHRSEESVNYTLMGLLGEAGEMANKFKKILRKDHGLTPEVCQELKYELGDVMWYVSNMAYELGLSLEEVATGNIEKLTRRKKENTLRGSGDDR